MLPFKINFPPSTTPRMFREFIRKSTFKHEHVICHVNLKFYKLTSEFHSSTFKVVTLQRLLSPSVFTGFVSLDTMPFKTCNMGASCSTTLKCTFQLSDIIIAVTAAIIVIIATTIIIIIINAHRLNNTILKEGLSLN